MICDLYNYGAHTKFDSICKNGLRTSFGCISSNSNECPSYKGNSSFRLDYAGNPNHSHMSGMGEARVRICAHFDCGIETGWKSVCTKGLQPSFECGHTASNCSIYKQTFIHIPKLCFGIGL